MKFAVLLILVSKHAIQRSALVLFSRKKDRWKFFHPSCWIDLLSWMRLPVTVSTASDADPDTRSAVTAHADPDTRSSVTAHADTDPGPAMTAADSNTDARSAAAAHADTDSGSAMSAADSDSNACAAESTTASEAESESLCRSEIGPT